MVTVVSQLLLLTRLQRALGLVPAYRLLTGGWVLSWIILPRLRDVLEWAESPVPGGDGGYGPVRGWPVTLAVNALLCFTAIVQLNFSLLMVIVNNAAPDRSALGAVNGISSSVGCLAKMLGPSIVSAVSVVRRCCCCCCQQNRVVARDLGLPDLYRVSPCCTSLPPLAACHCTHSVPHPRLPKHHTPEPRPPFAPPQKCRHADAHVPTMTSDDRPFLT